MPILVITEEPAILKVTIHITHAGVQLVAGVTTVKNICLIHLDEIESALQALEH